eukprot:TRINITY_DN11148_c0_g2_i1.p1 TRINITY_DN11148_c0_g2~~TRINITY_DN11148_c0_g2_i1.p1  ORF type:complete len:327 (+),score=22.56 TRINITY_DN11148_c0_g2_i1:39-1019(+)
MVARRRIRECNVRRFVELTVLACLVFSFWYITFLHQECKPAIGQGVNLPVVSKLGLDWISPTDLVVLEQQETFLKTRKKRLQCYMAENYKFSFTPKLPQKLPINSCAVVGNAGALIHHKWGTDIDQHDVVIRFNNARVSGYEAHVGSKETFRFASEYNLGSIMGIIPKPMALLWGDPKITNKTVAKRAVKRVLGHDNVFLFTGPVPSDKIVTLLHNVFAKRWFQNTRAYIPWVSMGAFALVATLSLCNTIDAYGMTDHLLTNSSRYHYYEDKHFNTHISLNAEHRLWTLLSDTPQDEILKYGKAHLRGYSNVSCDGVLPLFHGIVS